VNKIVVNDFLFTTNLFTNKGEKKDFAAAQTFGVAWRQLSLRAANLLREAYPPQRKIPY
jgi:hypothetical protein